jgi:catechol-2,3-dioxygenase
VCRDHRVHRGAGALSGLGLRRLQHLVLWVSNVERSVRFYCDVLGFEVQRRYPTAAFLIIPGTSDDHHLGLFEQPGLRPPDERVARMYHSAWEVGELTDLARARERLIEVGSLVGQSDHGTSLSLYAKDPDGLEFELFWTVPEGTPVGTRPLDLAAELARRGLRMPQGANA